MKETIYTAGYESYFEQLLSITKGHEINDELGLRVKCFANDIFAENFNANDFNRFDDGYVRSLIGRDEQTGWEALVLCWKKGNQTAIHGHPQFASYTILKGELLIETFELVNGLCKKVTEYTATAENGFFAIGEANKFDNHIHRISCLSDFAHSLHIYSDDARKGEVFCAS